MPCNRLHPINQLPTVNALQEIVGLRDAFVTKLNARRSALAYSTYLGANSEGGRASQSTRLTSAFVLGLQPRQKLPTPMGLQGGGRWDAFVTEAKMRNGSGLVYFNYLGGILATLGEALQWTRLAMYMLLQIRIIKLPVEKAIQSNPCRLKGSYYHQNQCFRSQLFPI